MNGVDLAAEQLGAFAAGMMDVLFAFSIALERRGLLQRGEIADALAEVQRQVTEKEGKPNPARATVAALMRKAFSLPLAGEAARARFQVIDGDG